MYRKRLNAAPAQAVSVRMPEVLVTSLYNGINRKNRGIYWKKTINFSRVFVFSDSEPLNLGMIIRIAT